MTISLANAILANTWGISMDASTWVIVLAILIPSQKAEPNISKYGPDYLFLVRHGRSERLFHYFISSYLTCHTSSSSLGTSITMSSEQQRAAIVYTRAAIVYTRAAIVKAEQSLFVIEWVIVCE